jgi:hypothetical protein
MSESWVKMQSLDGNHADSVVYVRKSAVVAVDGREGFQGSRVWVTTGECFHVKPSADRVVSGWARAEPKTRATGRGVTLCRRRTFDLE